MSDFVKETEATRARNRKLEEIFLGKAGKSLQKIKDLATKKRDLKNPVRRGGKENRVSKDLGPRRVSARIAGKRPVNYSDSATGDPSLQRVLKTRKSTSSRRNPIESCASPEAEEAAQEAAEKLCDELDNADWKRFSPSIVGGGFWCDAPPLLKQKISELDFPGTKKREVTFLIERKKYKVIILSRGGFSGGWRGLCIAEEYKVGDFGVFEWIDEDNIRLHVFRASDYE